MLFDPTLSKIDRSLVLTMSIIPCPFLSGHRASIQTTLDPHDGSKWVELMIELYLCVCASPRFTSKNILSVKRSCNFPRSLITIILRISEKQPINLSRTCILLFYHKKSLFFAAKSIFFRSKIM